MRRGKPQQEIYRPGCGPLRKSNTGIEESDYDDNTTSSLVVDSSKHNKPYTSQDDIKYKSDPVTDTLFVEFNQQRRNRKPEQMIYVPRHVANARDMQQQQHHQQHDNHSGQSFGQSQSNGNNGFENDRFQTSKSKRYSNRRRGGNNYDNPDDYHQDEWRDNTGSRSVNSNRQQRQGSEPRMLNGNQQSRGGGSGGGGQRMRDRDTRSVEPSNMNFNSNPPRNSYSDKPHLKPPSGRRHSTIGLESFDKDRRPSHTHKPIITVDKLEKLPPRFRKKFLEENQLTTPLQQQQQSQPQPQQSNTDDSWNGASLTFGSSGYGRAGQTQQQHHFDQDYPQHHHHHHQGSGHHGVGPPPSSYTNMGYSTLPHRHKGRGRLHHDYDGNAGGYNRSRTPDLGISSPGSSRPHTPPYHNRTRSSDNSNRPGSRPQSPVGGYSTRHRNDYQGQSHYQQKPHHERGDYRKPRYEERRNQNHTAGARNLHHSVHAAKPQPALPADEEENWNDHDNTVIIREEDPSTSSASYSDGANRNLNVEEESWDDDRSLQRHESPEKSDVKGTIMTDSQVSSVSLPSTSSEEKIKLTTITGFSYNNNVILDWSEEVELHDQLEAEALSDAMTRSSSVTSLVDISTKSMPSGTSNNSKKSRRKSGRRNKRRSSSGRRDDSPDSGAPSQGRSSNSYSDRASSTTTSTSNDGFKMPQEVPSIGRNNNHHHNDGRRRSRDDSRRSSSRSRNYTSSRECSFDRSNNNNNYNNHRRSSTTSDQQQQQQQQHENWREEIIRSRQNSDRGDSSYNSFNSDGRSRRSSERDSSTTATTPTAVTKTTATASTTVAAAAVAPSDNNRLNMKKGGVLVLPQAQMTSPASQQQQQPQEDANHPHQSSPSQTELPKYPETARKSSSSYHQKSLFDPNNPTKPIIIKSHSMRVSVPGFSDDADQSPPQLLTDQFGNVRPGWYEENSDGFNCCRYPEFLRDIRRADTELQNIIAAGMILVNWETVQQLRQFLKEALTYLLCRDLKFCQTENVEQHFWKILYHNIIEVTRKAIANDPANKEQFKGFLLWLIDEGTGYFEGLLESLEESHKFKLSNHLGSNHVMPHKSLGYVGLALISAQKLFLFLGDLGRYREQVNESTNYGKCRQWYIKAHEINPKNGKPYNQLAVLAMYARRKLDAVYYYMRSLMSSNPVPSAREVLEGLFDENRKKYEQGERKRREERLQRAKRHMKQKESEDQGSTPGSLRHETWIRPDGGRRVHRTTQAVQEQKDSEEEDLAGLSSVEVNKRFIISYLHVHGKLITKIGMESFQDAAMQMLKEFRALLQHSPVPVPCNRLLQLLALNMFAIESTQLKDPQLQLQTGYRSELQERALVVSLQMFNLILERCVSILQENAHEDFPTLPHDVHVMLPAVKIWCDWMLCHSSVWNPPPSTQDFKVGTPGDVWSRLAILMNLLERLDQTTASTLTNEQLEGYETVKLPEDSVLCGFTPLMVNEPDFTYAPKNTDVELAQFALRMSKLLFFGTVFLCGLEPPVLKLEIEDDFREYVSVVSTSNSRDSPALPSQNLGRNSDVLMESFSEDEDEEEASVPGGSVSEATSEVQDLLTRKVELERTHRRQQLHKQRVKKILSQAVVSVHIEVRPKYLVPDTNCFIDHLDGISAITASHVYTLMVPIVVLSELEGLSKGGKSPTPTARSTLDPQHVRRVAQASKTALDFLKSRPQMIKCVTTKGAVLSSTTFTTEDDSAMDAAVKNDDKILATCLVLGKGHIKDQQTAEEGEPKKLVSEVVLLTEDRNLRVKALARDVPVRELPDFMHWAGLG